jgi:hypothetical protein
MSVSACNEVVCACMFLHVQAGGRDIRKVLHARLRHLDVFAKTATSGELDVMQSPAS